MSHELIEPDAQTTPAEKWQEIRNRLYALACIIVTGLFVMGVIDGVDRGNEFVDILFSAVDNIVAIASLAMAWNKSRLSKTVTLDIPANAVTAIEIDDTVTIAGPGSPMKTGTIIS